MGGTKILAAIMHPTEGLVAKKKMATNTSDGDVDYAESIGTLISELVDENEISKEDIRAVCLGVPGSVNIDTGVIGVAPNLGLKNYNIKDELQKYIDYPILIENDVNIGALGIQYAGIAKEKKNVLVVFIGTGIGGGIILNGKLYRGTNFIAGEIGHMPVVDDGPVCGCGNYGCFEALASRTSIVRDITKEIKDGKNSELSSYVKKKKLIKSKALAAALRENDKVTVKTVKKACQVIGRTLAGVNNLLNLEMIVLGGGLIEAADDVMLPIIKESFIKNSMDETAKELELVATDLGDYAPLYGGLALAAEMLP